MKFMAPHFIERGHVWSNWFEFQQFPDSVRRGALAAVDCLQEGRAGGRGDLR
jgi:hypothetical protein